MPQLTFKPGEKEEIERRQNAVYNFPLFRRPGYEPITPKAITEHIVPSMFESNYPGMPGGGGQNLLALAGIAKKGKGALESLSALGKVAGKIPDDAILAGFKAGDPAMEAQLVDRIITPIARKAAGRFKGRGVDAEDLTQEGIARGLEAARKWRESGSVAPLPSYLKTAVSRGTDEVVRTQGADVVVPQKQFKEIRNVERTAAGLKRTGSLAEPSPVGTRGITTPRQPGEEPGILQVSSKTGLPAVRVKEILGREHGSPTVPLEDLANVDLAKIGGGLSEESSSEIAKRMMQAGLSEKQLRALKLSMGIEGEPRSLSQIATEIGTTKAAAQKQVEGALARLKKVGAKPPVPEGEEAPRAGSEWFQRAKARIKGVEEQTGAKVELGESKVPRKIKPISGGSGEPEGSYFDQLRAEIQRLRGGGKIEPATEVPFNRPSPFEKGKIHEAVDPRVQLKLHEGRPLYHATPAGPGIEQSGVLEGRSGLTTGGLGGQAIKGVSTTTEPQAALETARLLARAGRVSREGLDPETLKAMAALDMLRIGAPEDLSKNIIKGMRPHMWQPSGPTSQANVNSALEQLREYYASREAQGLGGNPYLMMPDPASPDYKRRLQQIMNIRPSGIRTIQINPKDIPPSASIGLGTDPNEIRIGSDIPLKTSRIMKPAASSLLGLGGLYLGTQQPNGD